MARVRLSPAFDDAHGTYGSLVVARSKSGTVVRQKPVYKRRATPAQAQNEGRLRSVAAAWAALTAEEAEGWHAYADAHPRRSGTDGKLYASNGYNAFTALALVVCRLDPSAPIPRVPPDRSFPSDGPAIALSAGPGALLFETTGPNAPGVVTELLYQRLENVRRRPEKRFGHLAYIEFEVTGEVGEVPIAPGVYACEFRFLLRATGQMSLAKRIGTVVVP